MRRAQGNREGTRWRQLPENDPDAVDEDSDWNGESMKRTVALLLITLAAAAVLAGLVHVVLVSAHVSEPAATTRYGLTPRRLWATSAVAMALVGVVIGGLA